MKFVQLTPAACYQAMKSHDLRFDGRFFVGVATTGIYCRPICRVRLPRPENCSFHPSAAAAEAAGFRPCLRCRPELAPGFAVTEASATLARAAARMIEDGIGTDLDLAQVAARIGVTDRHLRRIFAEEFGVTPIQFAQTHRLLLAKRLLTDTRMAVTEVAFASGFSSVRRMHALFAQRYGFSPGHLRKEGRSSGIDGDADALTFVLPYLPPYDFHRLLGFFDRRAIPGVESVDGEAYRRIVRIESEAGPARHGWLEVSGLPQRDALQLRISADLAAATPRLLARTRRVFDVAADPREIGASLGALASGAEGLRLPGAYDAFELAMRAILGQQVTVQAARTLATRFVAAFGEPVATPFADLTRAFPTPARVAAATRDDIGRLGIGGQRAEAMIAVAQGVQSGELRLDDLQDPTRTIDALGAIRGIGPWTAHYIAMRALAWPDAWPPRDVALLKALDLPNTAQGQRAADAQAEAWRPWRSYAVLHLWRRLERPADKES
ncbi:MAG: helix-turn-helix domain-containing protein [Rhodocyclales bacterium]|nr:helix-turn-helix domain-containing protein [Rhodocyclales bacterium]